MADLQVRLYVCIGITWFAAFAALVLRVVARRMTRVILGPDDYFCLLAFLFACGYCAILLAWAQQWYLGQRIPSTIDQTSRDEIYYHYRKLGFFNSICYASSLACTKISILWFYWRLFKTSIVRIPILVMLVMSAVWWLIRTLMLSFRCIPTQAIWDKNIKDAVCNINADQFFLATITTHFLLDCAILVLPIIPVAKLRLRIQQKIAIVGFFLLGTIVCVASCIVLVILVTYPPESGQAPYDYTNFCIWGAVEVNIAIVSACCPLLRPLGRRFFPTVFGSSAASSHPISRGSKGIKLTTVTKSERPVKADDSSSIQQLADIEDGHSEDYGQHEHSTVHTNISSEANHTGFARRQNRVDFGIHVQKETVVEVKAL